MILVLHPDHLGWRCDSGDDGAGLVGWDRHRSGITTFQQEICGSVDKLDLAVPDDPSLPGHGF